MRTSKRFEAERKRILKNGPSCSIEELAAIADRHAARIKLLANERPQGCSKGCTGRMCLDALNCDGKR